MKAIRATVLIAMAVLADDSALAGVATNTAPEVNNEMDESAWSFSASASTYIVPNELE